MEEEKLHGERKRKEKKIFKEKVVANFKPEPMTIWVFCFPSS